MGSQGFSFNEVLISISLIGIGVLGFSLNTVGVIRGNHTSRGYTIATNLAQDKMEQLRAKPVLANENRCPDSGDSMITATGAPGGAYNRCWSVVDSPLGAGLKQIDVAVTWQDTIARQVTVFTLVFTDRDAP